MVEANPKNDSDDDDNQELQFGDLGNGNVPDKVHNWDGERDEFGRKIRVLTDYVKLVSNDGMEFTVEVSVLKQSPTLARMLEGPFKERSLIF